MKLARKFVFICRTDGFAEALRKTAINLVHFVRPPKADSSPTVEERRKQLSHEISDICGSTVRYGPFKGLKLSSQIWWGENERAAMCLGIYEQEILQLIYATHKRYDTFIDIGAADGYYGIGVLVANFFERSYCFETTLKGQRTILENAALNNAASKIKVFGEACKGCFGDIPEAHKTRSVLLVDIEGAEFDVLDQPVFQMFSKSLFIVEMHDWADGDKAKVAKLVKDSSDTHKLAIIKTGTRDLSPFNEVHDYSDNDRWLICSEGRPRLMSWYVFHPLQ